VCREAHARVCVFVCVCVCVCVSVCVLVQSYLRSITLLSNEHIYVLVVPLSKSATQTHFHSTQRKTCCCVADAQQLTTPATNCHASHVCKLEAWPLYLYLPPMQAPTRHIPFAKQPQIHHHLH